VRACPAPLRSRRRKTWPLLAGALCCWGLCTTTGAGVGAQEMKIRSVPMAHAGDGENPEDRALKSKLEMGEVEILGEVEKPKTMFVIPRAPHQYFWENSKKDFTEEILSPISRQRVDGLEKWRGDAPPP
jgi:hypothetical protein